MTSTSCIGDVLTLFLQQPGPARRHALRSELIAPCRSPSRHHDNSRAKDVWSTVGGAIKPCFELVVTTAGDALPFVELPPAVERVAATGRADTQTGRLSDARQLGHRA